MPSAAISQSLSSLVPSLTAPPPRLLSLAESLLALSRQRASHLKTEEEIARAYACCEIACDRLRTPLRLPPTKKGGQPCKPVVYRKLVGFLEGVLGDGGTSGKRRREEDGEVEVAETPTPRKKIRQVVEVTPSKSGRRDVGFLGKVKDQSAKRGEAREAPDYVMPGIRRMCKAFQTPEMAPHVYTGICIVLRLADLWPATSATPQESVEADVTTLLVALYLMVLTRMQRGKMTTKIFKGISNRAVEMFDAISDTQQIEDWIKRINSEGYCKGQDWWDSVTEGVFAFSTQNLDGANTVDEDEVMEDAEGSEQDEDVSLGRRKEMNLDQEDPQGVLLPGLGTMMSDAVDWLSDERKLYFQRWKRDLMKKTDRATAAV